MWSSFELIDDDDTNTDDLGPDLIELEALKLALGVTDSDNDDALSAEITRLSELIAEFCDRRFAFGVARETFTFETYETLRPGAPLSLQLYPIVDVELVTVDGTETDFAFNSQNGQLYPAAGAVWSGVVVVEYSGGYVLPDDAPARLQTAIIEAMRSSSLVSGGVTTSGQVVRDITHGDTHVSFAQQGQSSSTQSIGGLAPSVGDLLRPLKRITV